MARSLLVVLKSLCLQSSTNLRLNTHRLSLWGQDVVSEKFRVSHLTTSNRRWSPSTAKFKPKLKKATAATIWLQRRPRFVSLPKLMLKTCHQGQEAEKMQENLKTQTQSLKRPLLNAKRRQSLDSPTLQLLSSKTKIPRTRWCTPHLMSTQVTTLSKRFLEISPSLFLRPKMNMIRHAKSCNSMLFQIFFRAVMQSET